MADTAETFAGIHNENEFYSQHDLFRNHLRGHSRHHHALG